MAGFCRCAGVAGQQSAAQHHATANTRAERDNHSTLRALSAACQRFAQRGHIGIVSDIHLHTGFCFQIIGHGKIMPIQIIGVQHHTVVYRAGAADTNADHPLPLRKLTAQSGNVITNFFPRARQVRRDTCLLNNLAAFRHKGSLDVGTAQINAQIVHRVPPYRSSS